MKRGATRLASFAARVVAASLEQELKLIKILIVAIAFVN